MNEATQPLPIPDMEPQAITVAQYRSYAPEKFELWEGYLFTGPDYPDERHRLLRLLLVHVGLREAVKLVPEQRWREALEQVYG